jgi:hypothetical protein
MPRYFFHFSDGKQTFTDRIGVELASLAHARNNAVAQVREMKSSLSERLIQEWSGWKMIVIDANGKTVLEIGFDLIPRSTN